MTAEQIVDSMLDRVRDYLKPQPPEYYRKAAEQFVAAINPFTFNNAANTHDRLGQAIYTVYEKAGGKEIEKKFSKLGSQVFARYAWAIIGRELDSWRDWPDPVDAAWKRASTEI